MKKLIFKHCAPTISVMSTTVLSPMYKAAIIEEGVGEHLDGWDIPEGYGITEVLPGVYLGEHDPGLEEYRLRTLD